MAEEIKNEEETKGQEGNENSGGGNEGNKANEGGNDSVKTFTQEEVNRMMAKEKEQGRRAILAELGVTDSKFAKDALNKYQQILDAQKSDEEKDAEKASQALQKAIEAEQRATEAEAKVEAMKLNAKPDCVEDVIVLATAKMTDGADFKTIIGELRVKFPNMFTDAGPNKEDEDGGNKKKQKAKEEKKQSTGEKGTGGSVKNNSKKDAEEEQSLGARLAASRKKQTSAESSYFKKR